jgi:hypothetical protein
LPSPLQHYECGLRAVKKRLIVCVKRKLFKENTKMAKNKSVFGIYSSRSAVENAVTALRDAGFQQSDVSVLLPENLGNREIATQKNTKAPEGATAGAGSGALIGGTLGWLVGIGALAIPGLGPFIAAGPIMAALAGAGVGGAVGGVTGALVGMGIPEFEAKRYEGRLQKGGILVSVHCDTSEEVKRAKDILQRTGAEDISTAGESSADVKDKTDARDVPSTRKAGTGY